jgi:uncharacterized protein (TIGR02147 family)
MKKRPSVFDYHDYRLFIRDCIEYFGESERGFARSAKFSSAYMTLLLKGHRKITPEMRKKILKPLGLNKDEQKYFALICVVADTNSSDKRIEALKKIQKIRFYRKQNPRETEVFQYLARWYFVAIRELSLLPNFVAEAFWIQERLCFPVSIREISKALEFLMDHGFLVKSEDGKIKPPEKRIECKGEVFSIGLAQLYKQTFSLALESIDKIDRQDRMVQGSVLPVSKKNYQMVKSIMEEALKKVSELCRQDENADSVYYVGAMSFPMAENVPNVRQSKKKETA